MPKEATLQVRMDAQTKEQVELLYRRMGTSFAEGVRIFASQSLAVNGIPFVIQAKKNNQKKRIGIAKGKFSVPDDIDFYNKEIESMFGGLD